MCVRDDWSSRGGGGTAHLIGYLLSSMTTCLNNCTPVDICDFTSWFPKAAVPSLAMNNWSPEAINNKRIYDYVYSGNFFICTYSLPSRLTVLNLCFSATLQSNCPDWLVSPPPGPIPGSSRTPAPAPFSYAPGRLSPGPASRPPITPGYQNWDS